jgi:phosphate transport system substrate-binding protein
VLVQPAFYAKPGIKNGLISSTTYPIMAISYLLSNAQGVASTDLVNTQNLVNAPYNSSIKGSVTTIGPGTGYAFLNIASGVFGTDGTSAPGDCVNSGE